MERAREGRRSQGVRPRNSMQCNISFIGFFFIYLFYRVFLRARHGIFSLQIACTRFTRAFKTDYCKHPVRLTYANSVATNSLNERARWIFGCFKPADRANVKPANFVAAFLLIARSSRRQNCERKKKTYIERAKDREREREGGENFAFSATRRQTLRRAQFSTFSCTSCTNLLILITDFLGSIWSRFFFTENVVEG